MQVIAFLFFQIKYDDFEERSRGKLLKGIMFSAGLHRLQGRRAIKAHVKYEIRGIGVHTKAIAIIGHRLTDLFDHARIRRNAYKQGGSYVFH